MKRPSLYLPTLFVVLAGIFLLSACGSEHRFIKGTSFKGDKHVVITFAGPVDENWAKNAGNYMVYEKPDPDIALPVAGVALSSDRTVVTLTFGEPLNQDRTLMVNLRGMTSEGKDQGTALVTVKKLYFGYLLSILLGAMIIKNFVFTKYLGLCVFFGTSQKKSTAVGMGVTFTLVIVASAMMSWFMYQFVLKPHRLDFLQIIVFIGLVSLSVQAVDTILRKVNPILFKAFGVYLVLVIANCIILAVPLLLCALAGAWNGILVAFIGIQPIIATLILMVAGRGIAQLVTEGQIPVFIHEPFQFVGGGFLLGVPFPVIISILLIAVVYFITRKTSLGLFIESSGGNPVAARYMGIKSKLIVLSTYIFCAVCAGLSGLIICSDIKAADANNAGQFFELDAIAAVIIGGSVIGALIIQSITTTILAFGIPPEVTLVFKALVIIIVSLVQSEGIQDAIKTHKLKRART